MKTKLLIISIFMASALTGWAEGGQAGKLTWDLTSNGTLTISRNGAMDDWRWVNSPWYSVRNYVKTI